MNIISYPSTDTYVEVEHCYTGTHRVDDVQTREIGIQTSMTSADIDRLEKKGKRLDNPDQLMRELFVTKVTKNDKSVQKYTGLPSKQSLGGLFGILDKASPVLKYWSGQGSAAKPNYQSDSLHPKSGPKRKLTRFHEFLLTLVRLRLALSTFVIADLFGVSSSRVSQVFATWINFMYIIFTPLLKWLQGM
ncbi:uncharacterized protein LOC130054751 [Ostrea edulis]|uniref:uncharacterized protein LOC130054751 n=1 Tax=Ostrea edulis TaxID=37623 RepID=UPI0024AE8DF5|nr:uncharacterized protein LOC130054751 [Ostrea edulis]